MTAIPGAAALRARRTRTRSLASTGTDGARFWLAAGPALAVFAVFTIVPMASVVYYSFTDYSGFVGVPKFVGLDNYARIFSGDKHILGALGHTLVYSFFYVVVQIAIAFLLAVLLERAIRGAAFYRAAFFLPVVISSVAVAYTWSFMYDPNSGTINGVLRGLGLGSLAHDWLGDYNLALLSVIVVDLWRNIGYSIVIFIAGLGTIPAEVVEAARIDGAGPIAMLRRITIPLMTPTFGLVTVLAVNGALRAFDTVYLMTGGGPGNQTELYMTLAFDKAFSNRQFGLSSAMSILVVLVLIPVAILQSRLGRDDRPARRSRRVVAGVR
ncbi:sugar ABC transporter permease [Galbitalea sp. SE-J8]|uniref:carbohydrate ABC transporter permease n=1 Tax=Galbitalea sp. SE-J8 TaxID=3054952 RepID=UPI00259D13EA|nr:sugar ABC transporter permease [Galbitalea sp. SE-J8]MDM4762045.1 sugar ABC transporter permease [Galbitalea sp. SE-J8]